MLTKVQRKVLLYIDSEVRRTGMSPSFKSIGDYLGVSRGNAHDYVGKLIERGHLTCEQHRPHGLHLTHPLTESWMRWDDETQSLVPFGADQNRKAG